jgi:hypothetical protein
MTLPLSIFKIRALYHLPTTKGSQAKAPACRISLSSVNEAVTTSVDTHHNADKVRRVLGSLLERLGNFETAIDMLAQYAASHGSQSRWSRMRFSQDSLGCELL